MLRDLLQRIVTLCSTIVVLEPALIVNDNKKSSAHKILRRKTHRRGVMKIGFLAIITGTWQSPSCGLPGILTENMGVCDTDVDH